VVLFKVGDAMCAVVYFFYQVEFGEATALIDYALCMLGGSTLPPIAFELVCLSRFPAAPPRPRDLRCVNCA